VRNVAKKKYIKQIGSSNRTRRQTISSAYVDVVGYSCGYCWQWWRMAGIKIKL